MFTTTYSHISKSSIVAFGVVTILITFYTYASPIDMIYEDELQDYSIKELKALYRKYPRVKSVVKVLAKKLYKEKRYKESARYYQRYIRLDSNEYALISLGWCYYKMKRPKTAIKWFNRAIRKNPFKSHAGYSGRAMCFLRLHQLKKAKADLETALLIKAKPFYVSILGDIYLKEGRNWDVIKLLEKFIDDKRKESFSTYFLRARAYYNVGKLEKSYLNAEKAIYNIGLSNIKDYTIKKFKKFYSRLCFDFIKKLSFKSKKKAINFINITLNTEFLTDQYKQKINKLYKKLKAR